jgi:hypothetical protein
MRATLIIAFLPDARLDEVLDATRATGATGSTVITSARGERLVKEHSFLEPEVASRRNPALGLAEGRRQLTAPRARAGPRPTGHPGRRRRGQPCRRSAGCGPASNGRQPCNGGQRPPPPAWERPDPRGRGALVGAGPVRFGGWLPRPVTGNTPGVSAIDFGAGPGAASRA